MSSGSDKNDSGLVSSDLRHSKKSVVTVRRMKMADIAELAGVSVSTVSRSLAGSPLIPQAMRDKVEAIARANGYVVNQAARTLRLKTTRTIGIVLPTAGEIGPYTTDLFISEMNNYLSRVVLDKGFDVLLTKISEGRAGWLHDLVRSNRIDGVLMLATGGMIDRLNEVASAYLPMVGWGQPRPGQHYCSVGINNCSGGELATQHLVQSGRRNIVFMGPVGSFEIDERYRGYGNVMARVGQKVWRVETGFTHSTAGIAMQALIDSGEKFDAIFAATDIIAHGAKTVFNQRGGVVPAQCAFVGFDDLAMAKYLTPPLTTVRQPLDEVAHIMMDLLVGRMGGIETGSVLLEPTLIIRESA